jgi:hypothetical protein
MKNSKEHLSIWQVIDGDDGEISFTGTFKELKKFTLDSYELMNDEKDFEAFKKRIEKGDEVDYFKILEDMDYEISEVCCVTKDDFTEKTIDVGIYYYTDDDGKKVYDTEEMTNEFETKLKALTNE